MLCLPLLRCGVCGLRFVAFALFAFPVPLVAPLGLALFGLRCVVRLRLLVGVAFLFPLCPLSVVRALFGLFVLLSFVVVLALFALFGAGFLQHRPNYNLLLKESKKDVIRIYICLLLQDRGKRRCNRLRLLQLSAVGGKLGGGERNG